MTDITALKSTEQALRREKELSDLIITSSIDGILAYDRERRYTVWNPGMVAMTGLPGEEVLGRRALEVFPFLAENGEDAYIKATLRGERTIARDRAYKIPATGREGFYEARYIPLRDGQGQVIGGLGVIRDTTEHKAALDALRAAQSQVVQTGKLAAMGELGAGIAHELNQPLAGIKMLVSLMRKHSERRVGAFLRELEMISDQVDRMAAIVDNVRGFARQSTFDPQVCDAQRALNDAAMLMSEQMRLAGIEVVRAFAADLPRVLADPIQMQQVFLNLLSNAHHALEEREASRRLVLEIRPEGEGRVRFCVEDNGPGIPGEIAERIFDPFFTTKETGRGTGLGLSLAYGIVKEHGGAIRHERPRTGGTRFVVTLPAAAEGCGPPPTLEAAPEPVIAPSSRRGRVLVVDDEFVLRRVLSGCLEELGYPHAAAGDADGAEAELAANDYAIALIDLKMPRVSGLDLIERLRRSHPDLRLVAMSGFVTEDARQALSRLGVKDVLSKPFDTDQLEKLLGRLDA
jgi:two-component system NtrC family sensor kinase